MNRESEDAQDLEVEFDLGFDPDVSQESIPKYRRAPRFYPLRGEIDKNRVYALKRRVASKHQKIIEKWLKDSVELADDERPRGIVKFMGHSVLTGGSAQFIRDNYLNRDTKLFNEMLKKSIGGISRRHLDVKLGEINVFSVLNHRNRSEMKHFIGPTIHPTTNYSLVEEQAYVAEQLVPLNSTVLFRLRDQGKPHISLAATNSEERALEIAEQLNSTEMLGAEITLGRVVLVR